MSDLISRQAILNELDGCDYELKDWQRYKLKTMVKDIPSAQPERKKGQNDQPESAKEYCAECDHIEMCGWYPYEGCEFRSIPQPQRKTGKWIKISSANIYECSECGKNVMTDDISAYDFCHGCGARMEGDTK